MKTSTKIIGAIFGLLPFSAIQADNQPSAANTCQSLYESQSNALKLSYQDFDQTSVGWRLLSESKCYVKSAELILAYKKVHTELQEWQKANLAFHAAQAYAFANDYPAALELLKQATWNMPPNSLIAWNAYVQATAAFLQKDSNLLRQYRDEVAKIQHPANLVNLTIVDNMLANIDKPYSVVYSMPKEKH